MCRVVTVSLWTDNTKKKSIACRKVAWQENVNEKKKLVICMCHELTHQANTIKFLGYQSIESPSLHPFTPVTYK